MTGKITRLPSITREVKRYLTELHQHLMKRRTRHAASEGYGWLRGMARGAHLAPSKADGVLHIDVEGDAAHAARCHLLLVQGARY